MNAATFSVALFGISLITPKCSVEVGLSGAAFTALMGGWGGWLPGCISAAVNGATVGSTSLASNVVMFNFLYSFEIMGALVAIDMEDETP